MPRDSKNKEDLVRLNAGLDIPALKKEFHAEGRIHIPEILAKESAERLFKCLTQEIGWNLTYNDENGVQNIFAANQDKVTPQEWQDLSRKIRENAAARNFQFFYANFAVEDSYKQNLINDMYIARFYEFVNSTPFLDFIREITGIKTITHADQQATAYGPGHFLTEHNDYDPELGRKIAYVFSMTHDWPAEWGGLLQFINEGSRTVEGIAPGFNSLNLFSVPQRHFVSQVASYAKGARYSVTGWLLERPRV